MSISTRNVLDTLERLHQQGFPWVSSSTLTTFLPDASWATVKRRLQALLQSGQVTSEGRARATRYRLVENATSPSVTPSYINPYALAEPRLSYPSPAVATARGQSNASSPAWSSASLLLQQSLQRPLAARDFVTYRREFVEDYVPNVSALLPATLADTLMQEGRMQGQQPAGTYARKVLEPLLIDLSWSSSRLEGNRYTRLATEELFKTGLQAGDTDAVMLLNHKAAIEFLVDAVPEHGLSDALVRNLHALLMQDLLADTNSLGNIRQTLVNISATTYQPSQVPALLENMFGLILAKARQIKNPVEAAFFLWVNLAYLQPFEDGNKRTSRLAANVPLMLYNCAPLSFLDMTVEDYVDAMLGVYEERNVAMAADLFTWAYRRSIRRYAVTLEAVGAPDPVRLQFREALNEAIRTIVADGRTLAQAVAALRLSERETAQFQPLLAQELKGLDVHNCARYRLSLAATRAWVAAGRAQ